MKPALLLATVLAFTSSASAKLSFHCNVSDKTVDVGNLDIFQAVWQQFYASGTEFGVLSDKDYYPNTQNCLEPNPDSDLTVNVKLDARWGNEVEVGHWDMRNALVQVMWAFMQQAMAGSAYDAYTTCSDQSWKKNIRPNPMLHPHGPDDAAEPIFDSPNDPHYHKEAACGPESPNGDCQCRGTKPFDECMGKTSGYKVPSQVSIEVYDGDGKLLSEIYTVQFTAVEREDEDGGCGRWGAVGEVALSFVPFWGSYVEKAVKIYCRQ